MIFIIVQSVGMMKKNLYKFYRREFVMRRFDERKGEVLKMVSKHESAFDIYRIPPRFILVSQDTHFSFALFDNAAGGQLSPSWPLLLSVDFDEKDMRDYFRKRLYKSYEIN